MLEHGVIVCGRRGHFLYHIPMLHYFAVFETKDIRDRHAAVAWLADEMAVSHDQITFGDNPFEIDSERRVRLCEPFDKSD